MSLQSTNRETAVAFRVAPLAFRPSSWVTLALFISISLSCAGSGKKGSRGARGSIGACCRQKKGPGCLAILFLPAQLSCPPLISLHVAGLLRLTLGKKGCLLFAIFMPKVLRSPADDTRYHQQKTSQEIEQERIKKEAEKKAEAEAEERKKKFAPTTGSYWIDRAPVILCK